MTDVRDYPNVLVMEHPLIQHKLSILRDEKTGAKEFRELVKELAMLMAYEATRNFQHAETTVKTPVTEMVLPVRLLRSRYTPVRWTATSTIMATSFRVWAMRATGCSAPSRRITATADKL
jgi:hypothetical protein